MLMHLWVSCTLNHLASGSKPDWVQLCSTYCSFSLDLWLPGAYGLFLDTHSRTQTEGVAAILGMFLSWQITAAQEGMSYWASTFQSFSCQIHKLPTGQSKSPSQTQSQKWERIHCPLWQGCGWRILLQTLYIHATCLVQAPALDYRNILLGTLPASSLVIPNFASVRVIFFFTSSPFLFPNWV